jgi:hypothetical protein
VTLGQVAPNLPGAPAPAWVSPAVSSSPRGIQLALTAVPSSLTPAVEPSAADRTYGRPRCRTDRARRLRAWAGARWVQTCAWGLPPVVWRADPRPRRRRRDGADVSAHARHAARLVGVGEDGSEVGGGENGRQAGGRRFESYCGTTISPAGHRRLPMSFAGALAKFVARRWLKHAIAS